MSEKVILEVTMETARIIDRACDMYMRLRNGQFDELSWEMSRKKHQHSVLFDREEFDNKLFEARQIIFPDLPKNSNYGVGKDHDGDMAYEVHEVIRYVLAYHEHPEGGYGVDFHEPMNWSGEPMPKCEVITYEDKPRKKARSKRARNETVQKENET